MKSLRIFLLAAPLLAASDRDGNPTLSATLPPVLRPLEPAESRNVVLPGPAHRNVAAPAPAVPVTLKGIPPVPMAAGLTTKLTIDPVLRDPVLRQPLPGIAVTPAVTSTRPSANLPQDLVREPALYCQKQIGKWKESDARAFLGKPRRQRAAYDEHKAVNGTIYAFSDPSGRYKEVELDFDRETGNLRTVFVYPPRLTWQECRRLYAGPFTSADARQGRMFYSYTNRRLDVLVDASGKVVSLGWY